MMIYAFRMELSVPHIYIYIYTYTVYTGVLMAIKALALEWLFLISSQQHYNKAHHRNELCLRQRTAQYPRWDETSWWLFCLYIYILHLMHNNQQQGETIESIEDEISLVKIERKCKFSSAIFLINQILYPILFTYT